MKILFFGTPDYVVPITRKLKKYYEIVGVVTQEPKPFGRKKRLNYSAIDRWAHKKKIPIYYSYEDLPSADMGVCASFGKIIPKNILSKFPLGVLNVHPSLLPKYRGASPIQTQIIQDEKQTGVTVIKMDEKMDHGPIISSFKEEINPDDTFISLRDRLFAKSADFLVEIIPGYTRGKIKLKPQDESLATYTKIVEKSDGFVNLKSKDALEIERKYKAYTPWPGIWTYVLMKDNNNKEIKKILKIKRLHLEEKKLVIDEVQLEGKNPVSWKQFETAYEFTF